MAAAVAAPFVAGPFQVAFAGESIAVEEQAAATLDNAAAAWRTRGSDSVLLSAPSGRTAGRRSDSVRTYLLNRGVPATAIRIRRAPGQARRAGKVELRFAPGAISPDRR